MGGEPHPGGGAAPGQAPPGGRKQVLGETRVAIGGDMDIVSARQQGRAMAATLGFSSSELTLIATAISELARNIVLYAKPGEISLAILERGGRRGLMIQARDRGPGIPDIARVLQGGYSTSRSLGLGLSGVRRLMDDFEVESRVGEGTTVTAHKWTREY